MRAAFFDIDGTLFRNSLQIEHFKLLLKYEYIDEKIWINSIKEKYKKWEKRYGDFEEYLEELAENYISAIKGIDANENEFVAKRVIEIKGDLIYSYTKNKLEEHIRNGDKVIIISGSPSFLVSKMAEKYGVKDYKGTEYLIKDNKFTGELIPMWDSKSKEKAINEFVEKYNINLEDSYAYGDTTGDINMFNKVGNPVAINPAAKLLSNILNDEHLKQKMEIVIERKNVAYTIKGKNIDNILINYL